VPDTVQYRTIKKFLQPKQNYGTKGIRVATQIADLTKYLVTGIFMNQPLNSKIKVTNLRFITDSSKSGKI
jgi:hypothetical protein